MVSNGGKVREAETENELLQRRQSLIGFFRNGQKVLRSEVQLMLRLQMAGVDFLDMENLYFSIIALWLLLPSCISRFESE